MTTSTIITIMVIVTVTAMTVLMVIKEKTTVELIIITTTHVLNLQDPSSTRRKTKFTSQVEEEILRKFRRYRRDLYSWNIMSF